MVVTAVTTYEEALQKISKDPVYFVDIYDTDGTTWLVGFRTGRVRSESVAREPGLLIPRGVAQKFQERDGVMSIGNLDIEILDINNIITALQAQTAGFLNLKIVVHSGDNDIVESEYVPAWTGRVKKSRVNSTNTGIILSCNDNTGWINEKIYRHITQTTRLAQTMTSSLTQYAYVDDVAGFPTTGHVVIHEEVIYYYAATGGGSPNFYLWQDINGPTGRGALCTDRLVSHVNNSYVYRLEVIEENLVILLLNILTTTADGNNGPFDLHIDGLGLGMPYDEIDASQFILQRNRHFLDADVRLTINARDVLDGNITAGQVINKWLLAPVGAFIIQGWDGLLRLMVIKKAEDSPSAPPLDGTVIGGQPSYDKALAISVNKVRYRFNHNPGDGRHTEAYPMGQTKATELYGAEPRDKKYETPAWHIDVGDHGNSDTKGGATVLYEHLRRRWDHALEPTGLVKLRTIFKRANLDMGEHTQLDTRTLPKLNAPGWGVLGVAQPVDRQVNWRDSTIDWKLLYLSEPKRLEPSETNITLNADTEECVYHIDHGPGIGSDGQLYAAGYSCNYGYIKLDLTSPTDVRQRTVILSMNLWLYSIADWGKQMQYDFTLEYKCEDVQLLHQYWIYFLAPLDEYFFKVDYWGHNDTPGTLTPIDNTVYFRHARLTLLEYTEVANGGIIDPPFPRPPQVMD